MKKRMGKRGVSPILIEEALQVVIAVAAFLILFSYVGAQADSALFEANVFSKEIGLMASTVGAVPQNVDYLFHISSKTGKRFDVEIKDNFARVGIGNKTIPKSFWYYSNSKLSYTPYLNENKSGLISFTKQGDEVVFSDTPFTPERLALACPPINTEDVQWKERKYVIDPAHGGVDSKDLAKRDPGYVSTTDPSFYESKHTFFIANALSAKLKNDVMTRKENEFMSTRNRIVTLKNNQDARALISINIGREVSQLASVPAKDNYVIAYYYPGRIHSQKLGCMIANALLSQKDFLINGAAVVPLENELLASMQVGVILDLGNLEIAKDKNFVVNSAKIADRIYDGLGEYYS